VDRKKGVAGRGRGAGASAAHAPPRRTPAWGALCCMDCGSSPCGVCRTRIGLGRRVGVPSYVGWVSGAAQMRPKHQLHAALPVCRLGIGRQGWEGAGRRLLAAQNRPRKGVECMKYESKRGRGGRALAALPPEASYGLHAVVHGAVRLDAVLCCSLVRRGAAPCAGGVGPPSQQLLLRAAASAVQEGNHNSHLRRSDAGEWAGG